MMDENTYLNILSVDCVIFGFDGNELKILVVKRKEEPLIGEWAIPGGFVKATENLDDAAKRILLEYTSLKEILLEQVYTFGAIDRFPNKRVISIAYYALIKIDKSEYERERTIEWASISKMPQLVFDHKEIMQMALTKLRIKVMYNPIGFELLPQKFTLTQLQNLYEKILGKPLDKRNFRKKIETMNLVVKLSEIQKNVSHRAANYYSFDVLKYEEFKSKGFNFRIQ